MSVNPTKVAALVQALVAKFENKQANKKDDISGDYSEDTASYPTVKGVKTWVTSQLTGKQDTLVSGTSIKTINNESVLGSGNITIQGGSNVDVVTSWSGTLSDSKVPSEKLTKNTLDAKNVTVEKQATAETGYAHTYVIKQGGTALSPKINIPKDFLVKSGEVKTCTTANVPVQGYQVGDKYLDFVVNVKEGSATDEHIYILVKDLVDVYTADNSTLQLSSGQFSVKNGGIGTTQLSTSVNTSLGYADAFNSSAAAGISSSDISAWNGAVSDMLTISDVDGEIDDYLDAITEALTPSS